MASTIKKGVAWVTLSSVARNLVSLLQIAILTRLLDKSDFGIIAIATMFTSFTQLFLDMGVSAGIMHIKDINKDTYSSLFWLNIFIGVILTIVLFSVAPFVTASYNSEDLNDIVRILCFTVFLNGIGNQQRIVCQKLKNFKRLSIIEIITAAITLAVSIVTAYKGCGAFSLAYSTFAGILFNNLTHLCLGLIKDNRLSFHFRINETIPFIKIGIYSVGAHVLDFFTKELDIMIISYTLGLEFLGVYNVAKRICLAIYRFVTPIVNKVFTPILAEINGDKKVLYERYIYLTKAVSVFAMPLFFMISAFSPTIMWIIFGESFVEGAPVQSVFAVLYAFSSFMGICGTLQIATGRTDIGLIWTIFCVITTAVIFYISSLWGIKSFLFGILLRTAIEVFFIWFIQFRKILDIKFSDYAKTFFMPFITSLILGIPVYLFFYEPSLVTTIIGSCLYFALYSLIILRTDYRDIITSIINRKI